MALETLKTDIIISIHPQHVANIVSGAKDHEYRNYLLPHQVKRLWIYTTSPISAIQYVAEISHGKRPGSLTNEKGLKNAEFNQGKLESEAKYAYEILKLEVLAECITLNQLKANGWLGGPPQKYCYVKKPMAEALSGLQLTVVLDWRCGTDGMEMDKMVGVREMEPDDKSLGTSEPNPSHYTETE
jgi:hypothetical protein